MPVPSAGGGTSDVLAAMGGAGAQSGPEQPGQGADQQRAAVEQVISQIRDLDAAVTKLVTSMPVFGPEGQQMKRALQSMVRKAAQTAPSEGASSAGLPMSGA